MTVFTFLAKDIPLTIVSGPNRSSNLFLYAANYDVERMWENTELQKRVTIMWSMNTIALDYGKDPQAWVFSGDMDAEFCGKGFLFKPKVLELLEDGLRANVGYALYAQQMFVPTMQSIQEDRGLTEQSWAWLEPNFYYKVISVLNSRLCISTFFKKGAKKLDGAVASLGISVTAGSSLFHPIIYNEYL